MEKPAVLLAGMGTYQHRIATRSPEAQKFFDQGLNMLFGFNRHEAMRSFRRASELDPNAAMPHWGMAMAQAPHINMDLDGDVDPKASCAAIEKGLALVGDNRRDRAYLEAANARCPEDQPDRYIKAMREFAGRYPDDLDAAMFYAESLMIPVRWQWWKPDGTPSAGMAEAVQVLERVLRRNPVHPGANHFYIHAVEMSPTPERAIPSAQRLMGIIPAVGHMVHMPGHIWLLLGEWDLAAAVNERAATVDREYMRNTGVNAPTFAGYHIHNLHFIPYARAMQGRVADARKSADAVAASALPFQNQMPSVTDAFAAVPLYVMLRFGRWEEILASKPPDPKLIGTTAIWHYARSTALAAQGKKADATKEQAAFEAARTKVPADWMWLGNKAGNVLAVAAAALSARMAANEREAVPHWRRALEAQESLIYEEPPPWFYPLRESLGGALLRSGQAAEAEAVFREGIQKSPQNGRMLFGLLESLRAQGKAEHAALVQSEFERAWNKADVKLTVAGL
jgi:tetratricopeptide (TPR) repeat protein